MTLVIPIDFEGELSRRRETIAVNFRFRWLEVSADGYKTQISPLSAYTGARCEISKRAPTPIRIALERGMTPDGGVSDFVGEYRSETGEWDYMTGRSLTTTEDGRFFAANLNNWHSGEWH